MVEMQGIQGSGNSVINNQVSSDVSTLRADSLNQRREDEVKVTANNEESSDEDVVAVDLSTVVNSKSLDNNNSLPDLVKGEANKSYVSKAELAEARQRVQATEGAAASADAGSNASSPEAQPE